MHGQGIYWVLQNRPGIAQFHRVRSILTKKTLAGKHVEKLAFLPTVSCHLAKINCIRGEAGVAISRLRMILTIDGRRGEAKTQEAASNYIP